MTWPKNIGILVKGHIAQPYRKVLFSILIMQYNRCLPLLLSLALKEKGLGSPVCEGQNGLFRVACGRAPVNKILTGWRLHFSTYNILVVLFANISSHLVICRFIQKGRGVVTALSCLCTSYISRGTTMFDCTHFLHVLLRDLHAYIKI